MISFGVGTNKLSFGQTQYLKMKLPYAACLTLELCPTPSCIRLRMLAFDSLFRACPILQYVPNSPDWILQGGCSFPSCFLSLLTFSNIASGIPQPRMWCRRGLDAAEARWCHTPADHNRHLAGEFHFTDFYSMLKPVEVVGMPTESILQPNVVKGEVGQQLWMGCVFCADGVQPRRCWRRPTGQWHPRV